jgi:hypothetical protein
MRCPKTAHPRALLFATAFMAQLALVQPSFAQPMSKPDASALGKQLGTSAAPSIKQGITSGNPSQAVPGYTGANPNQTSYFQGGMGSTVGPGATKVAGCNTQTDLECQAVNLVAKARLTRPQFQIQTNDPLISKARAIGANPSGQIGNIFSTYDTCKSATTTTPAAFDTQVCQEYSVNENKVCSIGQEVVVDTKYNYQCDRSPNRIDNLQCSRILRVTTSVTPSCNNGDVLSAAGFGWGYRYRNGRDVYEDGGVVRAFCNLGGIELGWFRGNVTEGDYGSGSEFRPPPDINRLPTQTNTFVNPSEPTLRHIGSGLFVVGGCNSNQQCSYTLSSGVTDSCPAGQALQAGQCGVAVGPVTYVDNGFSGFDPTCPAGAVPADDRQCYQLLGYPEQVMSGGVMNLSFRQATNIINVYETWDNQCAGLEARAQ